MGKLHTLKRAIERNPQKYISRYGIVKGALFDRETMQWVSYPFYSYRPSYRRFVFHVLESMGVNVTL